jgi:hypothetical protein
MGGESGPQEPVRLLVRRLDGTADSCAATDSAAGLGLQTPVGVWIFGIWACLRKTGHVTY